MRFLEATQTTGFGNAWSITEFVISILLLVSISIFFSLKIKRFWVALCYGVLTVLFLISLIFAKLQLLSDVYYLPIVCLVLYTILTFTCLMTNMGVVRKYFAKSLKGSVTGEKKTTYDQETFIANVVAAVNWLSDNKVGALITFVKDTPLDDFMKSGTMINCPFTPEIVETIFYEGTRLHDGAIIIKNDIIEAAAVYYPPSTRPIQGKLGARHRAALGISEVTDAITIVVSEETGRISCTHDGLLDHIKTVEFERYLRNKLF